MTSLLLEFFPQILPAKGQEAEAPAVASGRCYFSSELSSACSAQDTVSGSAVASLPATRSLGSAEAGSWAAQVLTRPASAGLHDIQAPTKNNFLLRLEVAAKEAVLPSPPSNFSHENQPDAGPSLGEAGPEGHPDLQPLNKATRRRQQDLSLNAMPKSHGGGRLSQLTLSAGARINGAPFNTPQLLAAHRRPACTWRQARGPVLAGQCQVQKSRSHSDPTVVLGSGGPPRRQWGLRREVTTGLAGKTGRAQDPGVPGAGQARLWRAVRGPGRLTEVFRSCTGEAG